VLLSVLLWLFGGWRVWLRRQRTLVQAGCAVIVFGVLCLCLSGMVVPTGSWWQGTLGAFGVGFVVGGVIDMLAISGLNQVLAREQRRREEFSHQVDAIDKITDPLARADAAIELQHQSGTESDPDLRIKLAWIVAATVIREELKQRQAQDKHAEPSGHDDVSRAPGDS
jgi:hypothetical protein